jgi:hypothetical protein
MVLYGIQEHRGSSSKRQIRRIGEFRREWLFVVAALLLLLASLRIALAADRDPDLTFGNGGKNSDFAVARHVDGPPTPVPPTRKTPDRLPAP